MGTIAGVTITFGLPENDTRIQNVSIGQAWDGSWKTVKYRTSDRKITIPLRGLTTTLKNQLVTALESDVDRVVAIAPDSHVDLGAGGGVSINAIWTDLEFNATKTIHDAWNIELNFTRVV